MKSAVLIDSVLLSMIHSKNKIVINSIDRHPAIATMAGMKITNAIPLAMEFKTF